MLIPDCISHAGTQKERVPEEGEIGVCSMTIHFSRRSIIWQKKHATCKFLYTIRMRGAKKRGSLRRAKLACVRWSFIFDEDQLFNKKHAKCKFLYTARMPGPKKRGSLMRAKLACSRWPFTFYMRFRRSPWAPTRSTRFRQPDRFALTGRISRG